MSDQHTMQDPRKQYDQPKIPKQSQPEPGLDSKLVPQADHGIDSYKGSGRLKGRKALITGADSGIGRAVAIAFAREGADVALQYLPSEASDAKLVEEVIVETGQKVFTLPGDLMDDVFCQSVVDDAVEKLGGVDLIVNNAGKQVFCDDISSLPVQQVKDTFQINVFAMFMIVQSAMKYLKPGASIINTTSIQAYQPSEGLLDYAATKAAIANFTKGLAQQLAPKGIRVNGVAPGPVWTPLQPSHGQSQDKLAQFGEDTPLGRAGQPAELAPTYVFLASQESSFITGEIIGVTGGKPIS